MVSKRRYILTVILTFIATLSVCIAGIAIYVLLPQNASFNKLKSIFNEVTSNHIEELDKEKMLDGAIKGMLSATGDKYTYYLSAEEYRQSQESRNPSYTGIGVTLNKVDVENGLLVTNVTVGGPADEAGIVVGDIVVAIGGVNVTADNKTELIESILGEAGTTIDITVERGSLAFTYSVERRAIFYPQAFYSLLDNNIGYIRLTTFSERSQREFDECLEFLLGKEIKGLVLDLRGNLGGYKSVALHIAEQFIDRGSVICSTKNNKGIVSVDKANGCPITIPLVLLVDGRSASASEVLAGAIRGNDKCTLIGTTTFGKGIVQYTNVLYDGSYFQYTAEQWFTPTGEEIHGKGLTPDIVIENSEELTAFIDANLTVFVSEDEDKQLSAAIKFLTEELKNK